MPLHPPCPSYPQYLRRVDEELVGRLFPFQHAGVLWGLRCGGRALIADEPGLGKTVQVGRGSSPLCIEWGGVGGSAQHPLQMVRLNAHSKGSCLTRLYVWWQ